MSIAKLTIAFDQGEDWARVYVWETGSSLATVEPVPLSGATARLLVYSPTAPPPAEPVLSLSTTPNAQGSLVIDGAAGSIAASINKATTAELLAGVYQFSLFIDWPNGTSSKFLSGPFIVEGP